MTISSHPKSHPIPTSTSNSTSTSPPNNDNIDTNNDLGIGESVHSIHILFLVTVTRIGFLLFLLLASSLIPDHKSQDMYTFPLNITKSPKTIQEKEQIHYLDSWSFFRFNYSSYQRECQNYRGIMKISKYL